MQGRLLPPEPGHFQAFPREHWREEFALAQAAGLDAIEWIYDLYGADVNSIATDAGIAEMKRLSAETNVRISSLCADYIMDRPELDAAKLAWLIDRCRRAGISRMVLPFVDASQIKSDEQTRQIIETLNGLQPKIEIHLETSLAPAAFAQFLRALPNPLFKVNYDSGNSASLGYSPKEEFAAYGDRIGSVHIKDRVLGGGTVPLGSGAADFDALFRELKRIRYQGDYVLQAARETEGDEAALARRNLAWLRRRL